MDIIDRIRKAAPTEIDTFYTDLERRNSLDDYKINSILTSVFSRIDTDSLTPELSFRYHRIKNKLG